MNKKEILNIAMAQSAEDIGCRADDFLKKDNVVVPFRLGQGARKYIKEPVSANLVSYGHNVVAAVTPDVADIVAEYIGRYEFYSLFEAPNVNWLSEKLAKVGHKVCFMAEYYLPEPERMALCSSPFELRLLEPKDFEGLYLPRWSNALCDERRSLDMLAVGAYDSGGLIGLAGASADCEKMWQIGVDVLPEYRGKGVASALTSRLAREIFERGRVPFYCSAWSNIPSVRNAVKCGFIPSWVELTVKPSHIVDGMINRK